MEFLFGRCRTPNPSVIAAIFAAASLLPAAVATGDGGQESPEYLAIKWRLARAWNTWITRTVLSLALFPGGFGLNLAFKQVKWLDELTEEVGSR